MIRSGGRWIWKMGATFACLAIPLVGPSAAAAGPNASALFRKPVLKQMVVSPSGTYLASTVEREGLDQVMLRRRDGPREIVAFRHRDGIARLGWIDDRHLVVELAGPERYHVVTVASQAGAFLAGAARIRAKGHFVDLLPSRGGDVLWSVRATGFTSVYRIGISQLLRESGRSVVEDESRIVARLRGGISRWVADRDANVRAGLRPGSDSRESELWYRDSADSEWRLLLATEAAEEISRPHGISENGRDLVVSSKHERDTWALFELSTKNGELGRPLFAHPDVEVVDVFTDSATGEVIGAVYEHNGTPRFHHLDSSFDRYQRPLARAFPNTLPQLVSASRDRRYLVVLTTSPRDPGTYHVLDTRTNRATHIAGTMPWLDPRELADVEAFRVTSADGSEIEAYLTLPSGAAGRAPLVVWPHGGPSGPRNRWTFDPLVQFLAGGGLAVLQVNAREAPGRPAVEEPGEARFGPAMEDDVEAAVGELVRRRLVDGNRVCIAGSSYGGYSALISVIRSSGRYRCAASLNGPTDLLYDRQFYLGRFEEGRDFFEQYVFDPDDPEQLRSVSPAYRASEIRVPVLLVQGTDNRHVDVDHFYRMLNVLEAVGRPPEALLLRGAGHSLTRGQMVEFTHRLRKFLSKHLRSG